MPDTLPDLSGYIDRVLDTGVTDVADVAVKVHTSAPAEVIEAHLLYMLRLAVRDRMGDRRSRNPVIRGAGALTRQPSGRPVLVGRPVGGSRKRASQREQFAADRARWLADTIWSGGRRVTLGEATVADLFAAAKAMREQASQSVTMAVRYEEIAEVLSTEGVATVGALPDERLKALMDRP